ELSYASHKVSDVDKLAAGAEVMIGGMITGLGLRNAKRADNVDTRMARCNFEDLTGTLECVMFPRDFSQSRDEVVADRVCFVKASVDRTRDKPGLIINKIIPLEQGKRYSRGATLKITLDAGIQDQQIRQLASTLQRARGATPVVVTLVDSTGKRALFQL